MSSSSSSGSSFASPPSTNDYPFSVRLLHYYLPQSVPPYNGSNDDAIESICRALTALQARTRNPHFDTSRGVRHEVIRAQSVEFDANPSRRRRDDVDVFDTLAVLARHGHKKMMRIFPDLWTKWEGTSSIHETTAPLVVFIHIADAHGADPSPAVAEQLGMLFKNVQVVFLRSYICHIPIPRNDPQQMRALANYVERRHADFVMSLDDTVIPMVSTFNRYSEVVKVNEQYEDGHWDDPSGPEAYRFYRQKVAETLHVDRMMPSFYPFDESDTSNHNGRTDRVVEVIEHQWYYDETPDVHDRLPERFGRVDDTSSKLGTLWSIDKRMAFLGERAMTLYLYNDHVVDCQENRDTLQRLLRFVVRCT